MAAGYSKFCTGISNDCLLRYYSMEGINSAILRLSSFVDEGSKFNTPKILGITYIQRVMYFIILSRSKWDEIFFRNEILWIEGKITEILSLTKSMNVSYFSLSQTGIIKKNCSYRRPKRKLPLPVKHFRILGQNRSFFDKNVFQKVNLFLFRDGNSSKNIT